MKGKRVGVERGPPGSLTASDNDDGRYQVDGDSSSERLPSISIPYVSPPTRLRITPPPVGTLINPASILILTCMGIGPDRLQSQHTTQILHSNELGYAVKSNVGPSLGVQNLVHAQNPPGRSPPAPK